MFTRSRAHIFVRTADERAVISALDRWFRTWKYRRRDSIPAGCPGGRHEEVREWYVCSRGGWTILAPEDISEALKIAYAIHKADPKAPAVVSRAYKHGDWQLKAYHDRDLVFKIGDDPDHELAWVGRPLEAEGVGAAVTLFGGNAAFETFLQDLLAGRPDPRDLVDGLDLPPLSVGFHELASAPDGWTYAVWVHESSPLNR